MVSCQGWDLERLGDFSSILALEPSPLASLPPSTTGEVLRQSHLVSSSRGCRERERVVLSVCVSIVVVLVKEESKVKGNKVQYLYCFPVFYDKMTVRVLNMNHH